MHLIFTNKYQDPFFEKISIRIKAFCPKEGLFIVKSQYHHNKSIFPAVQV